MSDITFVIGGIGSGKSLFGARACMLELDRTERAVVTNVPLHVNEAKEGDLTVAEWCHDYVKRPVDLARRLRVLSSEEVREFYLHQPLCDIPTVENKFQVRKERGFVEQHQTVPDLTYRAALMREDALPMGTLYVIDEVHLYFGARDWQTAGSMIEWYMSQLRKMNDDLILITQHPDKVDKNFRRNATSWIYLKNFSKTRLVGGVTLPGRFRWLEYAVQPERGDKPNRSGWTKLEDKKFHKVYDTMAGAGIVGGLVPEEKRRGHHWSLWIVYAALVACACIYGPRILMKGFMAGAKASVGGLVTGRVEGAFTNSVRPVASPGPGSSVVTYVPGASAPVSRGRSMGVKRDVEAGPLPDIEPVRWRRDVIIDGFYVRQGVMTIMLSDDSVYQLGDGHFTKWDSSGLAFVDGQVFRFLKPAERAVWERREMFEGVAGGRRDGRGRRD